MLMPHLAVNTAGFDDADLQPVRRLSKAGERSGMMPARFAIGKFSYHYGRAIEPRK
jgi:hypothetical protein